MSWDKELEKKLRERHVTLKQALIEKIRFSEKKGNAKYGHSFALNGIVYTFVIVQPSGADVFYVLRDEMSNAIPFRIAREPRRKRSRERGASKRVERVIPPKSAE